MTVAMTIQTNKCRSAWQLMTETSKDASVRNFTQSLDMSNYLVETDVFPEEVLVAYSAYNMEKELTAEQKKFMNANRGGAQGDYRDGMTAKIANVVDCLSNFPQSKRALITISNEPMPDHSSDSDAKCVRELQLYLDDDGKLSGTVFLRAQAAFLFPKNIHMIGSIMNEIAQQLPNRPTLGTLFYLAGILVSDRG
jgi:thymidylate synthase